MKTEELEVLLADIGGCGEHPHDMEAFIFDAKGHMCDLSRPPDVAIFPARLAHLAPDLAHEVLALRQRVEAAEKMAEMLEKAIPWIGYQAHVPDILECSRRVLADFRASGGEG